MSDGYTGVALVGVPMSGSEELASVFESAGFFSLDKAKTIRFRVPNELAVEAIPFDLSDWPDLLVLDQSKSDLNLPLSDSTNWRLPPNDLRLALSDARDCAQGAPLLVSDPKVIAALGPLLDDPSSEMLPIIVLRNPLGVARSLAGLWSIPVHQGLAIWEYYACSICNVLNNRSVMAVSTEALAKSDGRIEELLFSVEDALSIDARSALLQGTTPIGPLFSNMTFESEGEFAEFATSKQQRLWNSLCQLANSPTRARFPADLQSPSESALDVLRFGAQHKNIQAHASMQTVKLATLYDDLTALYGRKAELEAELETANAMLAHRIAAGEALSAEGAQLRANAEEMLQRVRALSRTQGQLRAHVESLTSELAVAHSTNATLGVRTIELQQALEEMRHSETWMLGYLLLTPVRLLKVVARTLFRRRGR